MSNMTEVIGCTTLNRLSPSVFSVCRQDERTCPTETHVSISTPVKVIQMSTNVPVSLSVEAVDSQWMSVSPSRIQSHSAVPQSGKSLSTS